MKSIFVFAAFICVFFLAGCGGGRGTASEGDPVVPPIQTHLITADKTALTVTELGNTNLQTVTVTTSGGLTADDLAVEVNPNVLYELVSQSGNTAVYKLGLGLLTQSGTYSCRFRSQSNPDVFCVVTLQCQVAEYQIKLDVQQIIIPIQDSSEPTVTRVKVWSTQPGVNIAKLYWHWTIFGISAKFHCYDWDQSAIYYIYCNNDVPDGTYRVEVSSSDNKYSSGHIEVVVMDWK